jgi:hypothetical protein
MRNGSALETLRDKSISSRSHLDYEGKGEWRISGRGDWPTIQLQLPPADSDDIICASRHNNLMTSPETFQELPFETAIELFDYLSPSRSNWVGPRPEPALYRGHWCSDWLLVPTALGGRKWLTDGVDWFKAPCKTADEQVRLEFATLKYFWEESDRQGLRLPEDGQTLRNAFYTMEKKLDDGKLQYVEHFWPPTTMLSLLGLAQHSGIGTRLLDWSWDPYVAAYFAASGFFSEAKAPAVEDRIAIWKLLLSAIEVQEYIHGRTLRTGLSG